MTVSVPSSPVPSETAPPETSPLFASLAVDILADLDGIVWRRELLTDGTIHYPSVSGNVTSLLGYPPEALTVTARGALAMVHWADRESHAAAIFASAAALAPCRQDFRVITAGDETRWLREASRPRRLEDGRIVWDGIWLDNTRSMRAEVQHQLLMDHAEDCIFVLSDDRRITWWNAAAQRNFQIDPGREGTSLPLDELVFAAAATDPPGVRMGRRGDGTLFPFEMTESEVRSDGRLSLIVIGRDITRRRNAELRLAESERRLRLTFVTASLGIVITGMDGTIRFYNPAFEAMAEGTDPDLLGLPLTRFVPAGMLPPPARIPPPGMSFCVTCQPRLADGLDHHWRLTGTRFPPSPDEPAASLLFFVEDVTETTRNAHELRQLERLLFEGQKLEALGRLAGGIAHELNNMLGPILMGAEMISRTAHLDDRNDERCRRIIDAAKNSRDIVRSVLAYCRKERKNLEPVDLVRVFDDFATMAAQILPPTVRVIRRRSLDQAIVIGDAGQMQQVLLNLANNARDAMNGTGTLTLTLNALEPDALARLIAASRDRHPAADPGPSPLATLVPTARHVEIGIADTGCGIDIQLVGRIFDPFFTTKPVGQGTGLGLSVVQGIIKSMGGVITVDSAPGEGARFHVVVPLSDPPPSAAIADKAHTAPVSCYSQDRVAPHRR